MLVAVQTDLGRPPPNFLSVVPKFKIETMKERHESLHMSSRNTNLYKYFQFLIGVLLLTVRDVIYISHFNILYLFQKDKYRTYL